MKIFGNTTSCFLLFSVCSNTICLKRVLPYSFSETHCRKMIKIRTYSDSIFFSVHYFCFLQFDLYPYFYIYSMLNFLSFGLVWGVLTQINVLRKFSQPSPSGLDASNKYRCLGECHSIFILLIHAEWSSSAAPLMIFICRQSKTKFI